MTEIRPDYYKSGGLEVFDVIDAFDLNFNLGNAFKYIARAGKKGDKVEDLRKAVTYLKREIEKEEKARPFCMPDAFEKAIMDYGRESNLKNNLDSVFQRIESLDDDKNYYFKSLLSGIEEEYNYVNIKDMSEKYVLTTKDSMIGYQTEFTKEGIKELVEDCVIDLDDFEIIEVESDYEAGRQENL